MEDYLEKIYILIEEKGYARIVDIASMLDVLPSSATKMVQKLDKMGYVIYEKYRGIILSQEGKKLAQHMVEKHELLDRFFHLIGVNPENIYEEVEGIEHHISKQTAFCISSLVHFFEKNPEILQAYEQFRNQRADQLQTREARKKTTP